MKNITQQLIDFFFDIDFTTVINDGFKEYGLLIGQLSNKVKNQNNIKNSNLGDSDLLDY